jgi:hypothetical protein
VPPPLHTLYSFSLLFNLSTYICVFFFIFFLFCRPGGEGTRGAPFGRSRPASAVSCSP